MCKITWQKSEYNFIREKGIACFCKELQRGFWGGSLRALQWEGARDVKIGANHWHSAAHSTQLPVKTSKHFDIRLAPTRRQFLHLLPTPPSQCCHCCCYPLLFSTFQRRFDFWEVAAPFLGQLAHFMNHNTLYRLPPLHCCQPIWGCATAGGGGLGGGVGGGGDGGDRLDENKKWKRAMVVLIPWHWLVGCISIFLLFASFCCDM